jgi:hypothetical protein
MNTTATKMKKIEPSENDPAPVQANKTFNFSVSLYEYHGHAYISWNTSYPALVRLAVAIYNGAVPSSPNNTWLNAIEVTGRRSGNWDTGQTWGTGYSAALLGINSPQNGWMDIGVDTPVTS